MAARRDLGRIRAALARRKRQGLSWAALSDETGIPVSTLQYWQRKQAVNGADGGQSGFVEIRLDDREASSDSFEIELGNGARIRVPQRFDAESLATLLSMLCD